MLIIFILILGFGVGWANTKEPASQKSINDKGLMEMTSPASEESTGSIPTDKKSSMQGSYITAHISEFEDTHYLELINSEYQVNEWPDSRMLLQAWPTVPVGISQETLLHEAALAAVAGLFDDARNANIGTLYVGSGYRNYEEQKQLYEDAWDKSYVQPANHSEHHTGLAADIYALGLNTSEMTDSREAAWLAENAWRYGLILRYAQDKCATTQIAYEPWHFRYVGNPHAFYMRQHNMCLEEYLSFLSESGGYRMEFEGMSFLILYEKPENGLINIPDGKEYTVSGDNTGGYVITICE